jgi:predicted esterase
MQENTFITPRTARYYSTEIGPSEPENMWILFHGYGQSARYFMMNFDDFKPQNSLLIAPEGLSKFYLKGFDGRVGASWMTKENRENEIQDQLQYVDHLLAKIDPEQQLKIHLFGFSQGAAVACRWYQYTQRKVENLVIWGAGLPIETDAKMAQKYEACTTTFVLGDEDEFIKEERLTQYYQTLKELQFRHNVITYKGGHTLEKIGFDALKMLLKNENFI